MLVLMLTFLTKKKKKKTVFNHPELCKASADTESAVLNEIEICIKQRLAAQLPYLPCPTLCSHKAIPPTARCPVQSSAAPLNVLGWRGQAEHGCDVTR